MQRTSSSSPAESQKELQTLLSELLPRVERWNALMDIEDTILPQTYEEFEKNGRQYATISRTLTLTVHLSNT